jgi:hypothetical protein
VEEQRQRGGGECGREAHGFLGGSGGYAARAAACSREK